MTKALQFWVRDAGMTYVGPGGNTRWLVRRVPVQPGSVHQIYLWVVVLPPIKAGFIGSMAGRDLYPRIKNPRKHYRGGYVDADEIVRELRRRNSDRLADMVKDAIEELAEGRNDPPVVWS